MKTRQSTIYLDGSSGEGGGQILRTALTLSAITGKPFEIDKIRAGRRKPGLLRQHLACVRSAAEICDAQLSDVSLGSERMTFEPREVAAFSGSFEIGSAGSTGLVLQTILPILWHAESESDLTFTGGTHALAAPCFDYLQDVYHPLMTSMGADWSLSLDRHGFFPAGGGIVRVNVCPSDLNPVRIESSESKSLDSVEILSTPSIPDSVVAREGKVLEKELGLDESKVLLREVKDSVCGGNAILLRASCGGVGTVVASYGDRGKRAEQVAREAAREMKRYLASPAPVDEYLADQLLLPMALAGSGSFSAVALTPHFKTNVETITSFLPVTIETSKGNQITIKKNN